MLTQLLLLILAFMVYKKYFKKSTVCKKKTCSKCKSELENVKNEKIKLYGRESCGYTRKMLNQLKDENMMMHFHYVNTETREGNKEFVSKGLQGVPAFEYKGKIVVGYMPTKILFEKLNFKA